jgi:AraC-like DNA-binding protein
MKNSEEKDSYKIAVSSEFEDLFTHFYFAKNTTDLPVTKTLLPTFQTILVFSFEAKTSLISQQKTQIDSEKCLVLGPIKQAFEYTLQPNAEILVANFKDDAFYRFFGDSFFISQLPINPDILLKENCFTDLWNVLKDIHDIKARVDFVLEFCKPYLRSQNATTKLLAGFKDDSRNPIKAIASETKQTERNIQLTHKKHFGYTAKEVHRYQRFIKAIEIIQNNVIAETKLDWMDVVDECGYYDQSQLIHDFRYYINISPTKFLKFQQDICISKKN